MSKKRRTNKSNKKAISKNTKGSRPSKPKVKEDMSPIFRSVLGDGGVQKKVFIGMLISCLPFGYLITAKHSQQE